MASQAVSTFDAPPGLGARRHERKRMPRQTHAAAAPNSMPSITCPRSRDNSARPPRTMMPLQRSTCAKVAEIIEKFSGLYERAAAGVFLAFQYPVEIPGVPTMTFLKEAMNSQRRPHQFMPIFYIFRGKRCSQSPITWHRNPILSAVGLYNTSKRHRFAAPHLCCDTSPRFVGWMTRKPRHARGRCSL